jgi:hypothetical protein
MAPISIWLHNSALVSIASRISPSLLSLFVGDNQVEAPLRVDVVANPEIQK